MQLNESAIETLNDLVKINNDRIAGYERAIAEMKDLNSELEALFDGMIRESNQYKEELANKIRLSGGSVESGTTTSGKIYRAWMDVKGTFKGSDRKSILALCEFGEDAAQRAYVAALSQEADIVGETRRLIASQQRALKSSHDLINKHRDLDDGLK